MQKSIHKRQRAPLQPPSGQPNSVKNNLFLAFCLKFLGLVFAFSLLSLFPAYGALQGTEAIWSAHIAHWILSLFALDFSTVSEATLYRGSIAILEVKSNCSALHYVCLLTAAIIAYPAPWISRLIGILCGSFILLAANIMRIVCLFLIGCFFPGLFSSVHETYWPAFSLLITILVMASWIILLPRLRCTKT